SGVPASTRRVPDELATDEVENSQGQSSTIGAMDLRSLAKPFRALSALRQNPLVARVRFAGIVGPYLSNPFEHVAAVFLALIECATPCRCSGAGDPADVSRWARVQKDGQLLGRRA